MNNIAFLVGCEEYDQDNIKDLAGINNDIDSMQHALINNCDCTPEHTYLITNTPDSACSPTGASILNFLLDTKNELVEKSIDNLFFYFSGHGYLSYDNKICLILKDSIIYPVQYGVLTQDDIISMLEKFTNVQNFILVLDMCQNELTAKGISEDNRLDWESFPSGYIIFYSCHKNEMSYMIPQEEISTFGMGSVFTTCFVKSLDPKNKCYNVKDISEYLNREVPSMSQKWGYNQRPCTLVQDISLENVIITNHEKDFPWDLNDFEKNRLENIIHSIESINHIGGYLQVGLEAEKYVTDYYSAVSELISGKSKETHSDKQKINLKQLIIRINRYVKTATRFKNIINSNLFKFFEKCFKRRFKIVNLSKLGDLTLEFGLDMNAVRTKIMKNITILDEMEGTYINMIHNLRLYTYAIDYVLKKPKNRGTEILINRGANLKNHIQSYEELFTIISRYRRFLIESAIHIHDIVILCSSMASSVRWFNANKKNLCELNLPIDDIISHLGILNENIKNIELFN